MTPRKLTDEERAELSKAIYDSPPVDVDALPGLKALRDKPELNCPKCYGRRWHFVWCPDARR